MAARTEEAARAFLRHPLSQLRSRELAEGAIRSVALGQDDRIEIDFAADATRGGFRMVLYRWIFAGRLIALMAWLVSATGNSLTQIVPIWLTTAPIAVFEFRHSIVGSVEALYRVMAGAAGWFEMATEFILPAVLGNIIGGFVFVAPLNHRRVGAERSATRFGPRRNDGE